MKVTDGECRFTGIGALAQPMTNTEPARIFVGIKIATEVAGELVELSRPLEGRGARLVPRDDIHLTLVPPWNETDIAGTIERLHTVASHIDCFLLTIVHLGYGPDLRHPRLLWADCIASEELTDLWAALMIAYGRTDARPFRPHVTVARIRRNGRLIARANPMDRDLRLTQYVNSIELFQSRHQNGYRVIVSQPLAGATGLVNCTRMK